MSVGLMARTFIAGTLRGAQYLWLCQVVGLGPRGSKISFSWYHTRERRRHFVSYAVYQDDPANLWTVQGGDLIRIEDSVKYKFFSSQIDSVQYLDYIGGSFPEQLAYLKQLEDDVLARPEQIVVAVRLMSATSDAKGLVPVILDGAHRAALLLLHGKKIVTCRLV